MIYELRIYQCIPGKLPALLKRFETKTLDIWKKHGIRPTGFWTVLIGDGNNDLHYLLAWELLAEREQKWNAFQADPEWHKARDESEKDGLIIANIKTAFLRPTAFSANQITAERRLMGAPARRPLTLQPERRRMVPAARIGMDAQLDSARQSVVDRRQRASAMPCRCADRRALRAGKPRPCAGNGVGAEGDRRAARRSASSTRPRSTRPTAPAARARAASGSTQALPIFAEIRDTLGVPGAHRRARGRAMRARRGGRRRAANPGVPVPADRSAGRRREDRPRRSTSRRASSSRPGT